MNHQDNANQEITQENKYSTESTTAEEIQQKLNAMQIYCDFYIHRDTHMWSLNFKFFSASLIVMLLPNMTRHLAIDLPEQFSDHLWLFPAFGIVLAFLFLYNAVTLIRRFRTVSNTFVGLATQKLPEALKMELLSPIFSQKSTSNKKTGIKAFFSSFYRKTHTYYIPFVMFFGLVTLGIVLLVG